MSPSFSFASLPRLKADSNQASQKDLKFVFGKEGPLSSVSSKDKLGLVQNINKISQKRFKSIPRGRGNQSPLSIPFNMQPKNKLHMLDLKIESSGIFSKQISE